MGNPSSTRIRLAAALLLGAVSFTLYAATLAAKPATAKPVIAKPAPMKYLFNMVHHNPGEPRFVTPYNKTAYLKKKGYNGQVNMCHAQCAVTYASLDQRWSPPTARLAHGSPRRARRLIASSPKQIKCPSTHLSTS